MWNKSAAPSAGRKTQRNINLHAAFQRRRVQKNTGDGFRMRRTGNGLPPLVLDSCPVIEISRKLENRIQSAVSEQDMAGMPVFV